VPQLRSVCGEQPDLETSSAQGRLVEGGRSEGLAVLCGRKLEAGVQELA